MTKYHAVLFMCNDEKRARWVIENFKEHNPDIPLTVYNGGEPCRQLVEDYDIALIEGPNLWHKNTRHKPGSFSYKWFEFLFDLHERHDPDYLIFLETDVKVNRKITIDPKYDVSGPIVRCGLLENMMMYDYWDAYLKGKDFHEHDHTNWPHKYHSAMGGTALSRNFFNTCRSKLGLVKECYELIPFHCYQDVLLSCFARSCGCTLGDWDEASDTRGIHRRITDTQWRYESQNNNCALVHNIKI